MSKRKKLIEHGKTLLIIVLLISAAALLFASDYVSLGRPRLSQEVVSGGQTGAAEGAPALTVSPAGMVISGTGSSRCAFYYNSEQLGSAFESFAAPLAEALGSAGPVREITRAQWQQRLLDRGVFFDFYSAQPLSLLSALLGSTAGQAGDYSADCLLLSCTDEGVELCFAGEADGLYYSCTTAVSASTVISRAESYGADSSYFAFASDKFPWLHPDTVILDTDTQMHSVLSENAAGAVELEGLMSQLGMNSYVIRPYTEADGTRVYVESGKTLRVSADGSISFKSGAVSGAQGGPDEAVMLAASVAQQALLSVCGDAKLCFAGVGEQDGAYTVRFEYVINGIVVELPGRRAAAQVTVNGGETVKLELQPRRYTLTQETRPLLPMAQAAAIASSRGGGRIWLVYMDSGNSASCEWVTD